MTTYSQLGIYSYSRLCAVGVECGFSSDTVLAKAGLEVDLSRKPDAKLGLSDIAALYRQAMNMTNQGYFPLALAKRFSFDFFPEIEAYLASSPDLMSASRVMEWLPHLLIPELSFGMQTSDNKIIFSVTLNGYIPCDAHNGILESVIAGAVFFLRKLMGTEVPCAPLFAHKPITSLDTYSEYLDLQPAFEQPFHGLELLGLNASHPISKSGSRTHAHTLLAIERTLHAITAQKTIKQQVQELLNKNFDQSADTVAHQLGMPLRTLQRRLKDEEASFQTVLEAVQLEKAKYFLADPELDIDSIAIKLGFSDRHSFGRAFKRWTKLTPAAWRNSRHRQ
jgi:AraC-like DNA-binding protein